MALIEVSGSRRIAPGSRPTARTQPRSDECLTPDSLGDRRRRIDGAAPLTARAMALIEVSGSRRIAPGSRPTARAAAAIRWVP